MFGKGFFSITFKKSFKKRIRNNSRHGLGTLIIVENSCKKMVLYSGT